MKNKVLYKFDQILPDGTIRKASKIYTVSIDVFKNFVEGQAYLHEYTVKEDKMKTSELIKNSCCATHLDVPKSELVYMVEKLESDNDRLINEVKRLESEKRKSFHTMLCLFFGALISVIFFAMVK